MITETALFCAFSAARAAETECSRDRPEDAMSPAIGPSTRIDVNGETDRKERSRQPRPPVGLANSAIFLNTWVPG